MRVFGFMSAILVNDTGLLKGERFDLEPRFLFLMKFLGCNEEFSGFN